VRVLVTRPDRPGERTAERLRALGHEAVLVPLLSLHFAPPDRLTGKAVPDGIILTSANAARAIARHPELSSLTTLPLWTVGSRTTAAARELGFRDMQAESLDLDALAALLNNREGPGLRLLHLAGEDRAGDLSAMTAGSPHIIETQVVYRAKPASVMPPSVLDDLAAGRIDAVLHYSGRTAAAYLRVSERKVPVRTVPPLHLCLSENVAAPLRRAGGTVRIATLPTEDALLACLSEAASPSGVPGAN
jgi:uroporphyrinogen-III synthase